jgi:DNA repair protein RecN (Recombination protein N)
MIERFYLKNNLIFDEVELLLEPGLIVFTGPSGSGKSVLMNSILASLGLVSNEASLSESNVKWEIDEDSIGILNEDINIFKQVKKEKTRYFINNQSISKKILVEQTSKHLRHLSLKDYSDFKSENLIKIVDSFIQQKDSSYTNTLEAYQDSFLKYKKAKKSLDLVELEHKKINELKEFASFEISKIEEINPRIDEDEELSGIKKSLSQKEKIEQKIQDAEKIFEFDYFVSEFLSTVDVDSNFFDDTMNELRAHFDKAHEKMSDLDDVDIESVLDRIEKLSNLKHRYGSIEESLQYLQSKKEELSHYESIDITKEKLQQEVADSLILINRTALELHDKRKNELSLFESSLNKLLKQLYLRDVNVDIKKVEFNSLGNSTLEIGLQGTVLQKMSSGEFNRLRLALLTLKTEIMTQNGGVLMLDEIDANLSGEESMSVAKVLQKLAKKFQIFVISHQPQLTSMGEHHYLVSKRSESNFSYVNKLNKKERINEIARMISTDGITKEAIKYASKLMS